MANNQFAKKNNWQETDTPLKNELDRMDTGIQTLFDSQNNTTPSNQNIFDYYCTEDQDDVKLSEYVSELIGGGYNSFKLNVIGNFVISTTPQYTIDSTKVWCLINSNTDESLMNSIKLDWSCAKIVIPPNTVTTNTAFIRLEGTCSITIEGLQLDISNNNDFKYVIFNNTYRLENMWGGICKICNCKFISNITTQNACIINSENAGSFTEIISCEIYAFDIPYVVKSNGTIHLIDCKMYIVSDILQDRTVIKGYKVTLSNCNLQYLGQYGGSTEWNSDVTLIKADYKLVVYGGEYIVQGQFKISDSAALNLFSTSSSLSSTLNVKLSVCNTYIYLSCTNEVTSNTNLKLNCIKLIGSSTYSNVAELIVSNNIILSDNRTSGFAVYGAYIQPIIEGNSITYYPESLDTASGGIYLRYCDSSIINNNIRNEGTSSGYSIVTEGSQNTKLLAIGNVFRNMKTNVRGNTSDIENNLYI